MGQTYLSMQDLSVGYYGRVLIGGINIDIAKGEIVTLIGPNGSGKSTILKSIIRQLELIGGRVCLEDADMKALSFKTLSRQLAVVLTQPMHPELMSCREVVATGRYPYTGHLGILSYEDELKVEEAMAAVHVSELSGLDFTAISDGQRQRVLLARALCQEPDMIVLDEPTSFLDIRHKLELLTLLRSMAKEKGITILMSLHEIDLAEKISDQIVCVKGDTIAHYGRPEDVFKEEIIRELYDIEEGTFDPLLGSVELPGAKGKPQVFVISGGGTGIPVYRKLQKEHIPFAAGILFTNDIDYHVAKTLAACVITEPAYGSIKEETLKKAIEVAHACKSIINAGVEIGESNVLLAELIRLAGE